MVMQNPWDQFPVAEPVQPGPIYGPAPTPSPSDQRTIQTLPYEVTQERYQAQAAPAQARAAEAQARKAEAEAIMAEQKAGRVDPAQAASEAQNTLSRLIERIDRIDKDAADNSGWFETGFTGSLLRDRPGAAAYDLAQDLQTLDANAAFMALQKMRDSSPTGGALGQITERELDLLRSTIANLNPNQSLPEFRRQLKEARQVYADMLGRVGGSAPQTGTSASPARPQGEVIFGDDPRASNLPREWSPAQARVYDSWIAANPEFTAEQLMEFTRAAGLGEMPPDVAAAIVRDRGALGVASGASGTSIDRPPDISSARPEGGGGLGQTIDAGVRGIADVLTLGFADEVAATGDTIFGGGTYDENLARQRGIDAYDTQNNFGARLTGQVAGGFAVPSNVAAAARGAGVAAVRSGLGGAAARTAARQGGVNRLALEGAAFGGAYGFGAGEGNVGDRAVNSLANAALGGGAAYGLGRAGAAYAGRNETANALARYTDRREAADAAGAAADLGIEMMPADVGGPFVRRATGVAYQTPGGVIPIARGGQRVTRQGQAARDQAAARIGTAAEPEAAGQAAISGADDFRSRTSIRGTRLYEKAERLAGDARVTPTNALQVIDQHIAELSQTPGGAEGLSTLRTLREQLSTGTFPIQGVRNMRSTLRDEFAKQGLRGSDLERRMGMVVDAASQDIVASLNSAGRAQAARAYATADRYWRERLKTIDDTLAPIIGRNGERSGEEVFAALQRAGRGNTVRLGQFIRSLPEEEAATVRATLISQLGKSSAGRQDASGSAFSMAEFLTHFNQMQPGARRVLFGSEASAELEKLAKVATRSKEAAQYQNFSNTGSAVIGGAQGMYAFADPFGAITGLIAQYGAGKLLASPRFARWLARTPPEPKAARSHIRRLESVARTQPAIAADVAGLQQELERTFAEDQRPR